MKNQQRKSSLASSEGVEMTGKNDETNEDKEDHGDGDAEKTGGLNNAATKGGRWPQLFTSNGNQAIADQELLNKALGSINENNDYNYNTVKKLQNLAFDHLKKLEATKKKLLVDKKAENTEKENIKNEIEKDIKKVTELIETLKDKETVFKATGTDSEILEKITKQDKKKKRKNPILGITKPVSYQKNEYSKIRNPEYLLWPYAIISMGTIIVVSIAIAMDFTSGESYKQITIVMFVANMISTAASIYALYKAEVRISALDGKNNSDIALFSLGLALILTTILLLPWTFILQSEYVPGFDPCNTQIVVMASIGMIVLYSFVSYILINSLIKMSRVLKTYIHDDRKVVYSNTYYDEEDPENEDKFVHYHVLYEKQKLLIQSEFLSSLNKIKRFKNFLKYALLWSLPELLLSVVLTTIIVFKVKQLSVLTLLFINCSMYPFSLLLVSSIMFNNKIRAFESQRGMDTDLIIDFMGVEITQSWVLGLLSPLYTFLIKLYGMSGAS